MKKVMIVAAAVAMAAVAEAGIFVNTNCHVRSQTCPVVAFKVTANGKMAAPAETKAGDVYTTAAKLQIKKGALILFADESQAFQDQYGNIECCYATYSLYLQVKLGKYGTYPVGVFSEDIDSWSIFGKSYNAANGAEKTKKYSVESEIGLSYANNGNGPSSGAAAGFASNNAGNDSVTADDTTFSVPLGIELGLDDFAFIATAFGKGTYKYTYKGGKDKSTCSICTFDEKYEFTPGTYSGWFAGLVSYVGDYGCLLCNCNDLDVFGGTWKAKYNKTWSKNANSWEAAANYVFGAGAAASMRAADVE